MDPKTDIHIVIDKREYSVQTEDMTGAQLKALADIPLSNLLFREVHGPGDDELIANDSIVHLQDGEQFYSMPPGNFGGGTEL
jgi:hypothetical protein